MSSTDDASSTTPETRSTVHASGPTVLVSFGPVDAAAVRAARTAAVTMGPTDVRPTVRLPRFTDDGLTMLEFLRRHPSTAGRRVLAVADGVWDYEPRCHAVFGIAFVSGRLGPAVVSAARLREGDPGRLSTRMSRVVRHELGHTFGLGHCHVRTCVMCADGIHDGCDIARIDQMSTTFCTYCSSSIVP